ncbi:YhdP family phospholipid transporter [Salinicola rhizosphaerae]|uniref:TIGR02099 family protein n=1 Tax=Salinicola rhizosphaerae TaxID=1443141 RepID=A0ABQ3EDE8_9GAMM|nr:AsmA-like C-terminal region-containing protein [Salinicola rhizosphaerae]GHB31266.1 TIGR02099 family protein [Salinicola rhizosphaerae]
MRIVWRWLLTLVALGLLIAAVATSGIRLFAWQIDRLTPWLTSVAESQLDAETRIGHLSLAIHHVDPRVALDGLELDSHRGQPLLTATHVSGRLDSAASWQQRFPVVKDGQIEGLTLHLYQREDGRWGWPDGAGAAWFGGQQADSGKRRLTVDDILHRLLHQQLELDDASVVLHGREGSAQSQAQTRARVSLASLTLASRGRQSSIQAALDVDGQAAGRIHLTLDGRLERAEAGAGHEVERNAGLRAAVVGELDLSALSPAIALATSGSAKAIGAIEGQASAGAAWRDGDWRKGTLSLDVPRLRLVDTTNRISETLTDLGLDAGLARDGDGGWQAWVDHFRASHAGLSAVDWPEHLVARSTAQGWWLRTSPFELDGITDYLRYLPLPFKVAQTLIQLDPHGRVAGLELGQDSGEWYAQSALEGVSVTAWNEIPGGGPFDAWATFRHRSGTVTFAGDDTLAFAVPTVYAEPLDLTGASGQVDWQITADGAVISGENLKAGWRGASAAGKFGLMTYDTRDKPGNFSLDLSFANADARSTRVLSWLPTRVIDDAELRQWFAGDIGGIVKQGRLGLSVTLTDKDAPEGKMFVNPDDRLTLSLDIADGRLQYAPEWPALEKVYGHLQLDNMNLDARVDHATSHGLTTRDATVSMKDKQLAIDGHVSGSSAGLLDFLGHAPLESLSESFARWQSEGKVNANLHIAMPMGDESDAETDMTVDVDSRADIDSLTFPELQLTLADISGGLRYRRDQGKDYLTGSLAAEAFDGPVTGRFDIGGSQTGHSAIDFEGRAAGRGLLQWAGLSKVGGLLDGGFPYQASVAFDAQNNASLEVRSDLKGLAIHLPAPFGKAADVPAPLSINADIAAGTGQVSLADWGRARWRTLGEQVQGQVWLEGWPGADAAWPSEPGWYVLWRPNRIDTQRWAKALTALKASPDQPADQTPVQTSIADDSDDEGNQPINDGGGLKRVAVSTPCILVDGRCLGGLQADASPLSGGWRLSLDGEIAAGEASWQPDAQTPIDVDLERLNLDALTPASDEDDGEDNGSDSQGSASQLMDQIEIAPHPSALPSGLDQLPDGHVRIADFERQGQHFGPLEARWHATDRRLMIDPLRLSLGELDLDGQLGWEASGDASLSRAHLSVSGGDVGSAFAAMNQPVPVVSETSQAELQLTWPGAPWQFALPLSSGRVSASMTNGRLRQIHSSSAKLVGLFNLDNILRRLQLDFSDVTSGGTAFNRIDGSATLYNGILKTEGPVVVDGTSTRFTVAGSVDLNRQTLDQRLGITVPVSQNLPLVAVMAGAPQVGLGLFLFDKLFGQWLDSVTQIYYRIEGPWSSPNISLESAQ